MKVFCRLAQALAWGMMVACLAPASFGALELRMAPQSFAPNGLPGPVDVDIFVFWDGNGNNGITGIVFDVTVPATVTLENTETPPNPLGFGQGRVLNNVVGFQEFGADKLLAAGDNLLTSLTFQTTATGVFPIQITLTEATRGGALNAEDITGQFTQTSSSGVIVVPEPTSLAFLAILAFSGASVRRRR
jgi:hypothetical protein